MNKLAFLLVIAALVSPCFAQESNKTQQVATNTKNVTITGTIKNFDEFVAFVEPETYIQLVPLSADGKYAITTDYQGRFAYKSDLPKLSVPKKATFSFNAPNTPPGKYFLAAQRLKGTGLGAQGSIFRTDKNELFIIDVPADAKSPFTIKAGDLVVRTH
jgi:hypothetical protein